MPDRRLGRRHCGKVFWGWRWQAVLGGAGSSPLRMALRLLRLLRHRRHCLLALQAEHGH